MPNRISMKSAFFACLALSMTACASTQQHDTLQKRVAMLSVENDTLRTQQAILMLNQKRQQQQDEIQISRIDALEQFRGPQSLRANHSEVPPVSHAVFPIPGEEAVIKVIDAAIAVLPFMLRPAFLALGAAAKYGSTGNSIK